MLRATLLATTAVLLAAPVQAQVGQARVVPACGGQHLQVGATADLTMNPAGQLCATTEASGGVPAAGGQLRDPEFLKHARTSGQTWAAGDHPQDFAVAYVDYGIGPTLPVKDLADPAKKFPNTCTQPPATEDWAIYCDHGSLLNGGPYLYVNGPKSDIKLEGLELSGDAVTGFGHECVAVLIRGQSVNGFVFRNNRFENDPKCLGMVPTTGGAVAYVIAGGTNLKSVTVDDNAFIGHAREGDCCRVNGLLTVPSGIDVPGVSAMVFGQTSNMTVDGAHLEMKRNLVTDWPGHVFGWGGKPSGPDACTTKTSSEIAENAFLTFHTDPSQGHGEVYNDQCDDLRQHHNVIWSAGSPGQTMTAQISTTQNEVVMTGIEIDHDTNIANRAGGSPIDSEKINWEVFAGQTGRALARIQIDSTPAGPVLGASINGANAIIIKHAAGDGRGSTWWYSCGANAANGAAANACPGVTSSRGAANVGNSVAGNFGATLFFYTTSGANVGFGHAQMRGPSKIHDNYIDPTGAGGRAWISSGGARCDQATPTEFANNRDLVTDSKTEAAMTGWNGVGGAGC